MSKDKKDKKHKKHKSKKDKKKDKEKEKEKVVVEKLLKVKPVKEPKPPKVKQPKFYEIEEVKEVAAPTYIKRRQLKAYLKSKPEVYPCDDCPHIYRTSELLEAHKQSHQLTIYNCDICPVQTNSEASLQQHYMVHNPLKYTCCNLEFNLYSNYRAHQRIHDIKPRYVCSHCGKSCKSQEKADLHEFLHSQYSYTDTSF